MSPFYITLTYRQIPGDTQWQLLFSSYCPCRRGVRLAMVTVISSSFSFFSPHFSLTAFSVNCFQLLLYFVFAVILSYPLILSRSLLTLSSHRILRLPRLRFPSTFWASPLFANFSSPILSTCPGHFSLLLTSFFMKLLHSNVHSQFVLSSLTRSTFDIKLISRVILCMSTHTKGK